MKKIFTLALAAAACLGAAAGNFNVKQFKGIIPAEPVAADEAMVFERIDNSRAAGVDDLTGKYHMGVRYLLVDADAQQAIGEFVEDGGNFEIVADPDVENGYIIKNFFYDFFNRTAAEEGKEVTIYDIKAVFNPETEILTIAAGQNLGIVPQESGSPFSVDMVVAGDNGGFDGSLPVTFRWSSGLLTMTSNAFMFGKVDGTTAYALPYQVMRIRFYSPNGKMQYQTIVEGNNFGDASADVFCVPMNGYVYVINFVNFDPYSTTCMFLPHDGEFEYVASPETPVGYLVRYVPSQDLLYDNEPFYACLANPNNNQPLTASDFFELSGSITKETAEEFEVTFPYFGLFSGADVLWSVYRNCVLTINGDVLAGIDTIAAEPDAAAAGPAVYYNLQGIRVNNPERGIFIRVEGNKSSKVAL